MNSIVKIFLFVLLITIVIGYFFYKNFQETNERDYLINELKILTSSAIDFYRKPITSGGGNYLNWNVSNFITNEHGSIRIKKRKDRIDFLALGKIDGKDGESLIKIIARIDSTKSKITVRN